AAVLGQGVNVVPTRPLDPRLPMPGLRHALERNLPGQPMYVGGDESGLRPLSALRYDATMMGTEFSVDLAGISLRGKAMKQLRHARNLHRRCAVTVREQEGQDVDWHQVAGVSDAWRERKAV